jgi:hypothetical protein
MLRERTFFLVLATLIVAGVAVGYWGESRREVQPSWRASPRAQANPARIWQERSFVKATTLSPATGVALVRPVSLKEDRVGGLLVLDWSAARVRRFSPTGQPGVSYGLQPGAAAGNPDDFDVDAEGNVWICYQNAGTVAELAPAGKLLKIWHLASRPHRVIAQAAGGLVIFAAESGRTLFHRYSPQGELTAGFGRLLAGGSQDLLALDGDVARDGAGGFVYAAAHAGLLAAYGPRGETRFQVATIDPVELPRIVQVAGKPSRLAPGARLSALTVSVSGDEIYVLADVPARPPSKAGRSRALDVYSHRDGRYLYSFHAPEPAPFALVAGDRLYTIRDDVVTRWRMKPAG